MNKNVNRILVDYRRAEAQLANNRETTDSEFQTKYEKLFRDTCAKLVTKEEADKLAEALRGLLNPPKTNTGTFIARNKANEVLESYKSTN